MDGYTQNKDDYLKRLRRIEGQVRDGAAAGLIGCLPAGGFAPCSPAGGGRWAMTTRG